MEIDNIHPDKIGEKAQYCSYCNTITWMEIFDLHDEGKPMIICKTCEMEASQLKIQFSDPNK